MSGARPSTLSICILRLGHKAYVPVQVLLLSSLNRLRQWLISFIAEQLRDCLQIVDESIHLRVSAFVIAGSQNSRRVNCGNHSQMNLVGIAGDTEQKSESDVGTKSFFSFAIIRNKNQNHLLVDASQDFHLVLGKRVGVTGSVIGDSDTLPMIS